MTILIKDSKVFYHGAFEESDVLVSDDGALILVSKADFDADVTIDAQGAILIPAFINPYLINSNKSITKSGYQYSLSKEKGPNTELLNDDFIYLLADVDDNFVAQNDDYIYFANVNDARVALAKRRYHFTKVKANELTKLKELKVNDDITSDVEIRDLLGSDSDLFVEAIKANLIDMISVDEAIDMNYVFGLVYSKLVKTKKISLEKAVELLTYNVSYNLEISGGELINFEEASLSIFDLHCSDKITEGNFKGEYVGNRCLLNLDKGSIKYQAI